MERKRWYDEYFTTSCSYCGTVLGISFGQSDHCPPVYCSSCVEILFDLLSLLHNTSYEELQQTIAEEFFISRVPHRQGTIRDSVQRFTEKGLIFVKDGKQFDLFTGKEIVKDAV